MNVKEVQQVILEMRSAVKLSQQFGTPVADEQLLREWADQLESALLATTKLRVENGKIVKVSE